MRRVRPRRRTLFLALLAVLLPVSSFPVAPLAAQDAAETQASADPVALAIRAKVGGKLKAFYRPRGYWPLWVSDGTIGPQAGRFLSLLESADLDGLDPRDYPVRSLRRLIDEARGGSPETLARAELALSEAFADYVRDVRRAPSVPITYLDPELEPGRIPVDGVLRIAALAPSFADYVERMGWMNPLYARLRTVLATYHDKWGDLPAAALPEKGKLKAGAKGPQVAMLRHRLGMPAGSLFDKAVTVRLKAFQTAHGLTADGVAAAQTIAMLNRSSDYYERLLTLNLDRARLLPGPWVRHVVVDAASARLWYFGNGSEQGTMKVVVGTPETQTPMLAGMVRYAILNPYWNVPSDLVQKRIAPKVLNGASLRSLRYEALSDWSANARTLDPATIDWHAVAAGAQEVRLRQLPGGANAMGRMKFMFPNDQGIYLHDTPDKALFGKYARHFSNGCVRLEDAPRLGKWFFGKSLVADAGTPEQQRPLPEPVPVYLTYLTAVPTDRGVAFLKDVYGRDAGQLRRYAGR